MKTVRQLNYKNAFHDSFHFLGAIDCLNGDVDLFFISRTQKDGISDNLIQFEAKWRMR